MLGALFSVGKKANELNNVRITKSETFNFLYGLEPDIIDDLGDYMDRVRCWRLTRAFPLLMLNEKLQRKTEMHKLDTPYRCIKCRKRGTTSAQLKFHNAMTHKEPVEKQIERFFSLKH